MCAEVTLYLLRHGKSLYNVREEEREASGQDYEVADIFDPPLASIGEQQARQCTLQQALEEQAGRIELWCSTLTRSIQTSLLALPDSKNWVVVDLLRECAGQKLCDSRLRLSTLETHVKELPRGDQIEWSFLVDEEEDPLVRGPREQAPDLLRRVSRLLEMMKRRMEENQTNVFVWSSHSALIAVILGALGVAESSDRWLANCEWRKITMPWEQMKKLVDDTLRLDSVECPLPILPKEGYENALNRVKVEEWSWTKGWPQRRQCTIATTESLVAVVLSTFPNAECARLSIVSWPFPGSKMASRVRQPRWKELLQRQYVKWSGPPSITTLDGVIRESEESGGLSVCRVGVFVASDLMVVVCPIVPPDRVNNKKVEGLPGWVTPEQYRQIRADVRNLAASIAASSILVLFPHDL